MAATTAAALQFPRARTGPEGGTCELLRHGTPEGMGPG